jgi:hypothetical protein
MKVPDIREDEVYARDEGYTFVRLVLILTGDGMLRYEEYDRYTGERFTTNRLCSVGAFARWASMTLPQAERARLKVAEAQANDRRESELLSRAIRAAALRSATDEELIEELRRRGRAR